MSKPKSKSKRAPHPPSLNAIYRQQLLLRDAVKALTQVLTETQARCEKLQFDKGVLAERVLKAKAAARVSGASEAETTTVYVSAPLYDEWAKSRFTGAFIAFKELPKPIAVVRVEIGQTPPPGSITWVEPP